MPAYDYECARCGWKGTLYQIKIAEADKQICGNAQPSTMKYADPYGLGPEWRPCGGLLKRSDEIPQSSFQIDAAGYGIGVDRAGNKIRGQFGGASFQKRRFSP